MDYGEILKESDPYFTRQHKQMLKKLNRQIGSESVVKKIMNGKLSPCDYQQLVESKSREKLKKMNCQSFGYILRDK